MGVYACGSSKSGNQPSAAEPQASEATDKSANERRRAKKHTPPEWPPKIEVDPNAFTDIPQAIDALSPAADPDSKKQASRAAFWLASQGPAAVLPLSKILQDENADLQARQNACSALGLIAEPALPTLIDAARSSEPVLRLNAIKHLGLIRPADRDVWRKAVRLLVELMEHEDEMTRVQAIRSLGYVGNAAQNLAAKPLQSILDDPDESNLVRKAAGDAIKFYKHQGYPLTDCICSLDNGMDGFKIPAAAVKSYAVVSI